MVKVTVVEGSTLPALSTDQSVSVCVPGVDVFTIVSGCRVGAVEHVVGFGDANPACVVPPRLA